MEYFSWVLGLGVEPKDLNALQVSARAVVVFFSAIAMVRIGDKRFLTRRTAFDAVLGFVLASTLARTINGSAPLLPTLAAGLVMVLLHRFLSWLLAASHRTGSLLKGKSELLIRDGVLVESVARANHLSEKDILEDVRLNGRVAQISDVALAYVERNGDISVLPR